MKKLYSMLSVAALLAGAQSALADYSLPGTYDMVIQDDFSDAGILGEKSISVVITQAGDGYSLRDISGDYFPTVINFAFDADTNVLTFKSYGISSLPGATGETSFTPYTTDRWDEYTVYDATVELSFDPETGAISKSDYCGFCWMATDEMDWNYPDHIYYKYGFGSAQQTSSDTDVEEPLPAWKDLGDATFMDGWVLPMLGIDQTLEANQWKVPLQQSTEDPNVYRLVDPYHVAGTAAAEANLSTKPGYIEFDVTDPGQVLFHKVNAGFAYNSTSDGEKKFNEFYCVNMLCYYMLQYSNYTREQIVSMMGRYMAFTTFEDGVVSLTYNDTDGLVYDAHYGTEYKPVCNGFWYYEENYKNIPVNMTARIVFPSEEENPDVSDGIENIEADKATARYYNLQGVEVSAPTSGIYVRVQGNKASKILF